MIRRVLFAAGVLAGLLGLVLVAAPGVAQGVAVSDILVYLLGVLALLLAVGRVQKRRKATRRETTLPEPEIPTGLPSPGEDIDDRIRNLRRLTQSGRIQTERQDLDARLEELAVRVIARREDIPRQEASRQLTEGTWTEDRKAASYFSESVEIPLSERLRLSIQSGSPTGVYAARAIEELAQRRPGGGSDD
jgi:hypothetical protein